MLATKKQIREIVQTLTDLQGDGLYRRQWADRAKDRTKVNLAFRFWDAAEADRVWRTLHVKLRGLGYTNVVKRTTVESAWETHTQGGEYVRVQALAE